MLVSCTSNNDFENGKQQLDSQGYTEIVNTGLIFVVMIKTHTNGF
jgi:hypothetical protein